MATDNAVTSEGSAVVQSLEETRELNVFGWIPIARDFVSHTYMSLPVVTIDDSNL